MRTRKAFVVMALIALLGANNSALSFASGNSTTGVVPKVISPIIGHSPTGVPGASLAQSGSTVSSQASSTAIQYHNGSVLNNQSGVDVYLIWYGKWATDTAKSILPTFITDLSNSPYFNINNTYHDKNNVAVTGLVNLKGQYTYATETLGTSLSDANIQTLAQGALGQGTVPAALDTNALYFVLTATDVGESSGFLSQYCGWHSSTSWGTTTPGATDMKYAFIGDAGTNTACVEQNAASPSGNIGADGMTSVMAHELEETISDPDGTGWYFSSGNENADQCAWTFGTTTTAPGITSTANVSSVSNNSSSRTATGTSVTNNGGTFTAPITSISNNSSSRAAATTVTFTANNSFVVGDLVTIPTLPSPYNTLTINNVAIKSRTSTSFTLALSVPKSTASKTLSPSVTATVNRTATSITYNGTNSFATGDLVSVTGLSGVYNVSNATITAVSSNSFTVSASPTGVVPTGTWSATATRAGTTITFTTAAAHGFAVGDAVTVSIPGYAAYTLTNAKIASVPSSTTFTVTATVPYSTGSYNASGVGPVATDTKANTSFIYNMTMNTHNYLIQQNWANRSPGVCVLQ